MFNQPGSNSYLHIDYVIRRSLALSALLSNCSLLAYMDGIIVSHSIQFKKPMGFRGMTGGMAVA